MKTRILHIIPNAHIDPVWLWTRQEGAQEAVSTCRTMVELMRHNPDLTFIRGESWVYEMVESLAPDLLPEIRTLIQSGRWDPVGGSYVQSDTNLPDTATFLHQFLEGKHYFRERFQREIDTYWSADSFGQSRGLVELFTAAGIRNYAFGRPESWLYTLRQPLFFWKGEGGSRLLCYRIPVDWYAIERDGIPARLDDYLKAWRNWDLENVAFFFGLGDHGGGPTQRHIDELRRWKEDHEHEIEGRLSTLPGYFQSAREELARRGEKLIDTVEGEINFAQRGYFANCQKIKSPYRDAEGAVKRAALWQTAAGIAGPAVAAETAIPGATPQNALWKELLFNTFHDILPGTCIEVATRQQMCHLGGIIHTAPETEFRTLAAIPARMDTRVPAVSGDMPEAVPFIVFNPRPYPWKGDVEFETAVDYRPVWEFENRVAELPLELLDDQGNPVSFQRLAVAHNSFTNLPWRVRVLFPAELPACGWRKFSLGYVKSPRMARMEDAAPVAEAVEVNETIRNEFCEVRLNRHRNRIEIFREGREIFGGEGIHFDLTRDIWGSWGCPKETPDAFLCRDIVETLHVTRAKLLERGPFRARMFIEFHASCCRVFATVSLSTLRPSVDLELRVLWFGSATRLRLVTKRAEKVLYDVTGGSVERTCFGDVPGGRALLLHYPESTIGCINDHCCGFGNYENGFAVTLIRGCRYATEQTCEADDSIERPATDWGEHLFRFGIVLEPETTRRLAMEWELENTILPCDRHAGLLPGKGSLLELRPSHVRLIDLRRDPDSGCAVATLQQLDEAETTAELRLISSDRRYSIHLPRGVIRELELS